MGIVVGIKIKWFFLAECANIGRTIKGPSAWRASIKGEGRPDSAIYFWLQYGIDKFRAVQMASLDLKEE